MSTLPLNLDLARQIAEARADIAGQYQHDPQGREFRRFADRFEAVLAMHFGETAAQLADKTAARRMAIILCGASGRREFSLFSDLDLGFLFADEPDKKDERFIAEVLLPLHDARLDVGHWARTQVAMLETIGEDFHSATAFIGARVLWGNEALFQRATRQFRKALRGEGRRWFLGEVRGEILRRHERNDTALLLEPDLKNSRGALRDLQSLDWVAWLESDGGTLDEWDCAGEFSRRDITGIRDARKFLLSLRYALHAEQGRRADQLTVDSQLRIAERKGYSREDSTLAEERLMREYYRHARHVDTLVRRAENYLARTLRKTPMSRAGGQWPFLQDGEFLTVGGSFAAVAKTDPPELLRYFSAAAERGLRQDEAAIAAIGRIVQKMDTAALSTPAARDAFFALLRQPRGVFDALQAMHRAGLLRAVIPEYALIDCLPRLDQFHRYTVDEHLIRSAAALEQLRDPESAPGKSGAGTVARDLLRPDLLAFSLLIHDIGKGAGSGHIKRGIQMIPAMAARLHLTERETQIIRDLVANHQRMSHAVLRRDPEDPASAQELADAAREPEVLRMIYVHSVADRMAVSETSWNGWWAMQFHELYLRAAAILDGRTPANSAPITEARSVVSRVRDHLTEREWKKLDAAALEQFVAAMPERYRRSVPASHIPRHAELAATLSATHRIRLHASSPEGADFFELTAVALDTRGLFRSLCQAIASRRLNIISAQAFTGESGICVDVFQLQKTGDDGGALPGDVLHRLEGKVNRVLTGEAAADWRIQGKGAAAVVSRERMDLRPPTVTIEQNLSAMHTVLDIKAPDRAGLLSDIAAVLEKHEVNIDLALISTESYRVVDVFYATDGEGNKLTGDSALERLRRDLLAVITPTMEPATAGEREK